MFVDRLRRFKNRIVSSISDVFNSNVVPEFDYIAYEKLNTKDLRSRIAFALNCESAENGSDTPDWILAEYLLDCLAAYDRAVQTREKWYSRPCGNGSAIVGSKDLTDSSLEQPTSGAAELGVKRSG